ncbi:MAG: carbon-nitrogen family hydrolase [Sporolactobacillus sp.]
MKVALIQLDIAFGNPDQNYQHADSLIQQALRQSPDVIVLPELWTTGYDLTRLDTIADKNSERLSRFASALSAKYNVNLIAGSVACRSGGKVTNTLNVFDRSGSCTKTYSKVHLFRLMKEERYLAAGEKDGLFTIDGTPAAAFICYDIRFPEWLRKHVLLGAKVLFIPAEWPLARLDHWRTLLICRAIENQAFVVACNRSGSDPDNAFAGHSLIISPWGKIIAEAGETEDVLCGEMDLEDIELIRHRIPVFADRRPALYDR